MATAIIARHAPDCATVVAAARRALRRRLPTANEIVYEYRAWFVISYSPDTQGQHGVVALRGDASGLRLYFNAGKRLPDPTGALQGKGGLVRWVELERAADLSKPAVARLLDLAIAQATTKFAPSGRGSILIRA